VLLHLGANGHTVSSGLGIVVTPQAHGTAIREISIRRHKEILPQLQAWL
jgi:hypothetical protein